MEVLLYGIWDMKTIIDYLCVFFKKKKQESCIYTAIAI